MDIASVGYSREELMQMTGELLQERLRKHETPSPHSFGDLMIGLAREQTLLMTAVLETISRNNVKIADDLRTAFSSEPTL